MSCIVVEEIKEVSFINKKTGEKELLLKDVDANSIPMSIPNTEEGVESNIYFCNIGTYWKEERIRL